MEHAAEQLFHQKAIPKALKLEEQIIATRNQMFGPKHEASINYAKGVISKCSVIGI
jgi:hypothetical protein